MEANEVEKIFENHRLILDWHKVTERPETARYTLETQIKYFNEYMFDWEWLTVKEVVSGTVKRRERLGFEDYRGLVGKILLPDPGEKTEEALTFVVEVEK